MNLRDFRQAGRFPSLVLRFFILRHQFHGLGVAGGVGQQIVPDYQLSPSERACWSRCRCWAGPS